MDEMILVFLILFSTACTMAISGLIMFEMEKRIEACEGGKSGN